MPVDGGGGGRNRGQSDRRQPGEPAPLGRREEILRVAAHVFAERGVLNATIRDIASAAGVLSGSLYHHFSSKDQIIDEVVRPVVDTLSAIYASVASETEDPIEVIRRIVIASIAEAAARPDEALIFRNDAHQFSTIPRLSFVDGRRTAMRRFVDDTVRRGIEDGTFRENLEVSVVVGAIFDVVFGSVRWVRPDTRRSAAEVGEQVADFVVHGLLCRPAVRERAPRPRRRAAAERR